MNGDINKAIYFKNIVKNADNVYVNLKKDVFVIKNTKNPLRWSNLSISTMNELINNFWELKELSKKYIKNNPCGKSVITAKKVIAIYEIIKTKLL